MSVHYGRRSLRSCLWFLRFPNLGRNELWRAKWSFNLIAAAMNCSFVLSRATPCHPVCRSIDLFNGLCLSACRSVPSVHHGIFLDVTEKTDFLKAIIVVSILPSFHSPRQPLPAFSVLPSSRSLCA